MPQIKVDTLIKTLRKGKKMTQVELSEEICSEAELSRIERGIRKPSWWIFERLMQRLGEEPTKYYSNIASQEDKRIMDIRTEIKYLLRDKTNTNEVEAKINQLEHDKAFQDGIHLQFLLQSKASIAFYREDYEAMYQYATEALKPTKPKFNENEIDKYVLLFDEIWLIQQIATAHFFISSPEKSTEILLKLKASLDRGYFDDEEKVKSYLSILYNITKNLGLLNKIDECIPICDEGITFCKKYRDSYFLPMFVINKACCLFSLRKEAEGTKLAKEAFVIFAVYDRFAEISAMKAFIESQYAVKIPYDTPE